MTGTMLDQAVLAIDQAGTDVAGTVGSKDGSSVSGEARKDAE